MGMHPKLKADKFNIFHELIINSDKSDAVKKLYSLNLINEAQIPIWEKYLEDLQRENKIQANAVDNLFLASSSNISPEGFLSPSSPNSIVKSFVGASAIFGADYTNIENLRGKTILDYGSGVYRPLNVATILYCNGFDKVMAFEPYPIKIEFAKRAFYHLIERMSNNPEVYIFSNISISNFLDRLRSFIDFRTDFKFDRFSSGDESNITIGNLFFCNNLNSIPINSIDVHLSNAVLEHIDNLSKSMSELRDRCTKDSFGIHIVDFLDHRHYDDYSISGMEKYYDGILDEINGLTPTEMENQIMECGWHLGKAHALKLPDGFLTKESRLMIERYRKFPTSELEEHVNYYMLSK